MPSVRRARAFRSTPGLTILRMVNPTCGVRLRRGTEGRQPMEARGATLTLSSVAARRGPRATRKARTRADVSDAAPTLIEVRRAQDESAVS